MRHRRSLKWQLAKSSVEGEGGGVRAVLSGGAIANERAGANRPRGHRLGGHRCKSFAGNHAAFRRSAASDRSHVKRRVHGVRGADPRLAVPGRGVAPDEDHA